MAGDWIKMRGNLWDDPRVTRICDLTDSSEGPVIGALYWLWATADQHTEDGRMPGLTLRQIDRKTGLPGFAAALVEIGWLFDDPNGVEILHFEEHNGASAKKRCQTARRVAAFKVAHADETQESQDGNAASVSSALPREEKRREEQDSGAHTAAEAVDNSQRALDGHEPTKAGVICRAMRQAGMPQTNPGDPRLLALIEQGATEAEFVGIAAEAVEKRKGWGWVLAVLPARRADAAALELAPKTDPPRNDAAEQTAEYLARQDAEFKAGDTPANRERVASAIAEARNRLTGAQLRKVQ
jgi:hypothetical protein